MQMVVNTEGETVAVPDADDVNSAKNWAILFLLGLIASAVAVGAWTNHVQGSLEAQSTATATVSSALTQHLDAAERRDENLTAILRMTDSMRIEMRHLTDAIRKGR